MAPGTNDSTGEEGQAPPAPPASGPDTPRLPAGQADGQGRKPAPADPEPEHERDTADGTETLTEPGSGHLARPDHGPVFEPRARHSAEGERGPAPRRPGTGRPTEPDREARHTAEVEHGTGDPARAAPRPGTRERVKTERGPAAGALVEGERDPAEPHHEPGRPAAPTPEGRGASEGDPVSGRRARTGEGGDGADREIAGRRADAWRRFAAAARRGRGLHVASCAVLLAVALTAGSVAVGGGRDGADAAPAAGAVAAGVLAGGDLGAGIRSLQAHLRAQPRDFDGWAALAAAYVEQARTQGDPSRYPQAERALKRSLALGPGNERALAGQAALAAARHDFTGALAYADRALKQNPYSERALCSRIDALVELGRYDEAADAAATADRRRPGVPVFTRYAYVRELRGDVGTAREVLRRALESASSPQDVAYVATMLGQLAWNQGEYRTALTHYARALAADEDHLPALEGRARAQAASGDRAGAIETLEQVVVGSPLPGPLVALGELYEARGADGDRAKAGDLYALVDAWTALARAGGMDADLDTALAAADHGDAGEALRAARAEWDRRRSVHTADALAWALHVNGRDEEALPYARRATATGYRNAAFLYHRGMIERAAGRDGAARDSLTAALELNPGFSPLGAREARTALKELEAAR
ncbi:MULTISPECIES: tetratricopeptide repeat protein [Streptomyces]|uniref:Tetratricopeptide repeat protein n=1 Tax=Streptomyces edwardsiae TaxID=3075527 RepID=A0ABU2Q160_9ACTN|nr:tetratricopeptide repeat protein [Streptomyces sp. DSM 41636]MDT0396989.1 tetratricopeptide repeat protein [Streptomyces sp. DSM 41636]